MASKYARTVPADITAGTETVLRPPAFEPAAFFRYKTKMKKNYIISGGEYLSWVRVGDIYRRVVGLGGGAPHSVGVGEELHDERVALAEAAHKAPFVHGLTQRRILGNEREVEIAHIAAAVLRGLRDGVP